MRLVEPRIQYAKTSDGVDIAYTTYGEGPPIVVPPNLTATHVQLETEREPTRIFIERLARRLRVIRYDARGTGMSQREPVDLSAEPGARDLAAVVDRLGLERFALYMHTLAGEGPFAYAAQHPDRVTALVCWVEQTVAVWQEVLRQFDLIADLMEKDWPLYCQIAARLMWGWDSPEATVGARMMEKSSSPKSRVAALEAILNSYRNKWIEQISAPTLIIHVAGAERPTNTARRLASSIRDSHVLATPPSPPRATYKGIGLPMAPFADTEVMTEAVADFVESVAGHAGPPRVPELKVSGMRAILWTDIEGHTQIMERLGDERGRELLREHERVTRDALRAHNGTEVKTMGDAFIAWFSSAQQAIECAVALQRAFEERNASAEEPLRVRVGINAGEPIVDEDDLFGASVIAASRICGQAAGGEIVVADVVRQLAAGKSFAFDERGETSLKGFEDTVRLYEVRWR
jgi:class 3 adenylate cyclase/pimeloyl-ACP methyl ester carboxylesterase